jgi:hypothetical protein
MVDVVLSGAAVRDAMARALRRLADPIRTLAAPVVADVA